MSQEPVEKQKKIERLAVDILGLARDNIVVHMRFLDIALAAMKLFPRKDIDRMATDGISIYYNPEWVLKTYSAEPNMVARTYLHLLLHLIFFHSFSYDKLDRPIWDLATDIAVEHTILSMELPAVTVARDVELREKLRLLQKQVKGITAEKVYKHLKVNELSEAGKIEWYLLYHRDEHIYWKSKKEVSLELEKWQKISERVKADLKSFSKGKLGSEEMEENLKEATRERHDYSELLRRFTVMGENIQINDDEFDYIYYHYGLSTYGNMPLIEPLEYKDDRRVREFIIALDTSASCKGEVVRNFLLKTYDILKSSESFFHKMNLHIIQCDNEIQQDTKITNGDELSAFLEHITLKGFGSTDFRPVFSYVEKLRSQQEFENLKGLIYFTDGYGIYPEKMPDYDCLFAFLKEDEYAPKLPPWALKVVLDEEEFEEQEK